MMFLKIEKKNEIISMTIFLCKSNYLSRWSLYFQFENQMIKIYLFIFLLKFYFNIYESKICFREDKVAYIFLLINPNAMGFPIIYFFDKHFEF